MCEKLKNAIDQDSQNGLIAIRHDESHLNAYLYHYQKTYKLLSPAYLYPEDWKLPFEQKILIREKAKRIDIDKIKGI